MKITIESWLNISKKIALGLAYFTIFLYLLFLVSPIVLTPIANKNLPELLNSINSLSGINISTNKIKIYTTPNLHIGFSAPKIIIKSKTPNILELKNFKTSLSVLSLIFKQLRLTNIHSDEVKGTFSFNNDGKLTIINDFQTKNETKTETPFGLNISNHLPNVSVNKYSLSLKQVENNNIFSIIGKNLKISDFILDKNIKLLTKGQILFNHFVICKYNIQIQNRIMPQIQLNDILFPKDIVINNKMETNANNFKPVAITKLKDLAQNLKNNKFNISLSTNLKVYGDLKNPKLSGDFNIDKFSMAINEKKLPDSNAKIKFKPNRYVIDSTLYTDFNKLEKIAIQADLKRNLINLKVNSNSSLENIVKIANIIIGKNIFAAKGILKADFNINTNLKKIESSGYLNLTNGMFTYSPYNITIEKINSILNFNNDEIIISKFDLEILKQALKISGKIKHDSQMDLNIIMEKLPIKGLVFALGKLSHENTFYGGSISANINLKGYLKTIEPKIFAKIENLNLYNKPLNINVLLSNLNLNMIINPKNYYGNIDLNSLIVKQNSNTISIPKIKLNFNKQDALIEKAYLLINNSRIDILGEIKNYLNSNKVTINIKALGNIASRDIITFIPNNIRNYIPYCGKLPISININGNANSQNIKTIITANPQNYISFLNIAAMHGKTTKIISNIKIKKGNANTDTNLYVSNSKLANVSGNIYNIFKKPHLNIALNIPNNISFPIWGLKNSNVTMQGKTAITGDITTPTFKGNFSFSDISEKSLQFYLKNVTANISGKFLQGTLKAKSFQFDKLKAQDLTSEFTLANYNKFYLTNLNGKAYDGKISGKMSYDIAKNTLGLELQGNSLNSTNTVYSLILLKNALTGNLNFYTKFTTKGFTYSDIVRALVGNATFEIKDGRFMGIGKIENIVKAQNITSNSILKTAISGLSTLHTIQKTDKFDKITGNITLGNGEAKINNIKVYGPLMSYYVSGRYYIITNSATLKILGRLDSSVVSCLGVLGSFSAEKLVGAIPKIGQQTLKYLKMFTDKPETENISLIPQLTSGSTSYKDFKVIYTGNIQKISSIRTFKWLSKCDTSQIDLKKEVKATIENVKDEVNNSIETTRNNIFIIKNNFTNILNNQKKKLETEIKQIENIKQQIENKKSEIMQQTEKKQETKSSTTVEKNSTSVENTSTTNSNTKQTEVQTQQTQTSTQSQVETPKTQTSESTNTTTQQETKTQESPPKETTPQETQSSNNSQTSGILPDVSSETKETDQQTTTQPEIINE